MAPVSETASENKTQGTIPLYPMPTNSSNTHQLYRETGVLPRIEVTLKGIHTEADVAAAWQALSQSDYQGVVATIKQQRMNNRFSDWGLLQLLHQQVEKAFEQHNQRQVYIWFVMTKLGYQLHAGFDSNQLVLLFACQQTVYEKPYYQLHGHKLYLLNPVRGKLRLPRQAYPGSVQALDLRFGATLFDDAAFGAAEIRQQLITVDDQAFSIATLKPRNRFLASYPQLDLQHYFSAPVAPITAKSLKQQLLPVLEGKAPLEQVNWLLHWMQFGFEYQVDGDQFGQENYFHPEESFVFAANDCEDRSFILSWLLRELLGLPVIGLTYPGHVATAVAFPEEHQPSIPATLQYAGRSYWIADPTYIGAMAGQIMPQYRNQEPQVVVY
jgi:hypothetical protein